MKPYTVNTFTAIVVIGMSAWSYFGSDSPAALIPGIIGLVFLALSGPIKKENRVVAHIIALLTFLLLMSLKSRTGALEHDNTASIVGVTLMMAVCLMAPANYARSFINVRRNRA